MDTQMTGLSFSGGIREELKQVSDSARHCRLAELSVYVAGHGRMEDGYLYLEGHSPEEGYRIMSLLKKLYEMKEKDCCTDVGQELFRIPQAASAEILAAVKYDKLQDGAVSELLIKNSCCRRAFLRGNYMLNGSMSDPKKGYHLEFACSTSGQAEQVLGVLADFDVSGHIIGRAGRSIVYIKEAEAIAEVLNIIGAHRSLMELENLRIEKALRSDVNRRVNCDTANIQKMLTAAQRQIEDIRYLQANGGLSGLPESLQEIAMLRLENPDAGLKELGTLLIPPLGKSGINHRLRKLSEIAEKYRKSRNEHKD